jgi:hypothetical protein
VVLAAWWKIWWPQLAGVVAFAIAAFGAGGMRNLWLRCGMNDSMKQSFP